MDRFMDKYTSSFKGKLALSLQLALGQHCLYICGYLHVQLYEDIDRKLMLLQPTIQTTNQPSHQCLKMFSYVNLLLKLGKQRCYS